MSELFEIPDIKEIREQIKSSQGDVFHAVNTIFGRLRRINEANLKILNKKINKLQAQNERLKTDTAPLLVVEEVLEPWHSDRWIKNRIKEIKQKARL